MLGSTALQCAYLALDVGDFRLREHTHIRLLARWVDAQREQFPDLRQRKPDILRALDKADAAHCAFGQAR